MSGKTARGVLATTLAATASLGSIHLAAADPLAFTPGDLVISTVACSVSASACDSTQGGLDTASPIALQEFQLGTGGKSVTSAGTLTLPQAQTGANYAISGEYGSASEGILQLSTDGHYLTIMGYGINANQFNGNPSTYGTALGQTTSVAGQTNTVPRVVGLIDPNGYADTTTALTGIFNENNPRSVATVNGSSFYVSGQGASKSDPNQGVFYALRGATTATPIDNTNFDTRVVSIFNNGLGNQLFVSQDENPPGSGGQNFTNVSSLGAPGSLPTSATTPTHVTPPASPLSSGGNNGSINLTPGLANGINNSRIGKFVYLSPEQYFFASPTVLYVTDSGQPKNGNANAAALGEGGLQKWVLVNGTWTLEYDLVAGLNLVNNANANSNTPTAPGVTGLFGLTGEDVDVNGTEEVELFATSYGLNELSPSYLYEITDTLADTTIAEASGESFTTLYDAPAGTDIRGVAFAPVPEPSSLAMLAAGLVGISLVRRRRRPIAD